MTKYRTLIWCWSHFYCCEKIPDKNNLRGGDGGIRWGKALLWLSVPETQSFVARRPCNLLGRCGSRNRKLAEHITFVFRNQSERKQKMGSAIKPQRPFPPARLCLLKTQQPSQTAAPARQLFKYKDL